MLKTVFSAKDYKNFIRSKISENKELRGYQTRLAVAAGCQKSFFSNILKSGNHLTPDHALGLSRFWRLSELEQDYFLSLLHSERAATKQLREYYEQKMKSLQETNSNLGKRFAAAEIQDSHIQNQYYSSWLYTAIHMLATIPKFQTIPSMSEKLGLSQSKVKEVVEKLIAFKLVEKREQKIHATKKSIHLARTSRLVPLTHLHWRTLAVEEETSGSPQSLHYTAVHTLSRSDVLNLREMFLEMIEKSRQIVARSPEEELICINIDFFEVGA